MSKKKQKKKNKIRKDQIVFIISVWFFLFIYCGENRYAYSIQANNQSLINQNPLPDFKPHPYSQRRSLYNFPEISAQAVYIYDPISGTELFKQNAHLRLAPASTTKLLTSLVALDLYNLDQVLEVRRLTTEGKLMNLFQGERMTLENLLYGALVHSANDAAYVIAENYSQGVEKFVDKMNQKAREIGMNNSHFTNPVGYDHPKQYITARDLALLSQYAHNNSTLAHMMGTKKIVVADESYRRFHQLENVNDLLGEVPGVAGVKTGFTQKAGENLTTLIKRGDKSVYIVILKSSDRFGDTKKLVNWIFKEFKWITPPTPDQ